MKKFLKEKWVIPVATLVLTLSLGSAAFAATGSASTDTSAADTSTAVTSTAPVSADTTAADATTATADNNAAIANGATSSNPWGNQRSDETLLTDSTAEQVKAVAVAKIGSDATVVRVETDSDASTTGHAKYEVHMVKADGTAVTVYVDGSFNYVGTEDQPCGGQGGGHRGGPADADSTTSGATESTATTSTSTSSN